MPINLDDPLIQTKIVRDIIRADLGDKAKMAALRRELEIAKKAGRTKITYITRPGRMLSFTISEVEEALYQIFQDIIRFDLRDRDRIVALQRNVEKAMKTGRARIKYRENGQELSFEVSEVEWALEQLRITEDRPKAAAPQDVAASSRASDAEVACVAEGTRIALPHGRQEPIERVVQGQAVIGYHDGLGRVVVCKVTRVASHPPASVVRVSTNQGELVVTPGHRLLTARGWTRVSNVTVGEEVGTCNVCSWTPARARVESIAWLSERRLLYNLYVEDACTYVADGLIAHSYVVLPALRTQLNRLRLALTNLVRKPEARTQLGLEWLTR
jgi:hypothetical protein